MLTTTLFSIAVTVSALNGTTGIAATAGALPASLVPIAGLTTAETLALSPVASTRRPPALVPLYGSLIALQGADVYFTSRAVSNGAREVNPIVKPVAGRTAAAAAVKAGTTALAIYFVERAWRQNRKGAIVVAAVLNAATAAVVVHNVNRQ
jgi:Domain of unknown function (DUF5658)